ncbi:hypothetical protein [Mucilaginibacter pedocola]|uniref:Uncharacterized protein n=1 Tax=Mucilaginibacter pedocola TaxID=1792845 RepID=A0A1S9PK72_9SPHI|nr:hypothetical protein [Mucilaginibacter pedocola]OOQ61347.1 hypothetical protein BC343_20415 [Mucilaginibacter pedocola]
MKQKPNVHPAQLPYNKEVANAYHNVLNAAKRMIAALPAYEARCSLELDEKHSFSDLRIHQFVSPLLYLSLEVGFGDKYYIHFGYEQFDTDHELAGFSSVFLRTLYRLTSKQLTAVNIEDCIHTNNIITTCSELFEVIDDSNHKRHTFKEIRYKPKVSRRKLMKAVA